MPYDIGIHVRLHCASSWDKKTETTIMNKILYATDSTVHTVHNYNSDKFIILDQVIINATECESCNAISKRSRHWMDTLDELNFQNEPIDW